MSISSKLNEPQLCRIGRLSAVLDCGCWHNRCLQAALEYLPDDVSDGNPTDLVFLSTVAQDACRVAREYGKTRDIILISERILPSGREFDQNDPQARYFIFVVLHETVHAVKRHKSPFSDGLSPEESVRQEEEADSLAMEWFNEHVAKRSMYPPMTVNELTEAQEKQQILMKQLNDGV